METQLGGNVKALREAAGLTQQQLATKAGLSMSGLGTIEQGKKPDPRLSTVVALANALGVTVDELIACGAKAGDETHGKLTGRGTKGKGKTKGR
jgi:transcriptional regulator with XRE-family HTH domain